MNETSGERPEPQLDEVSRRLREIQARKRGGVRWTMSRHTAELAIDALQRETPDRARGMTEGPALGRGSPKGRRRKGRKRLL